MPSGREIPLTLMLQAVHDLTIFSEAKQPLNAKNNQGQAGRKMI